RNARTAIPAMATGFRPCSCARAERRDAERGRHLVDLGEKRRVERHAALFSLLPAREPSLSGHANGVAPWQPSRGGKLANVAIDLRLENCGREEARDVERDHELPDIELTAGRQREIPDVAAEGRAVERPRQQTDDDGEPASLVAAHGQI